MSPDAASLPAARRGLRTWLGPLVSALCLVHCLGIGMLAPLLPAATSVLAASREAEWGLWGVSAGIALLVLFRPRPRAKGWAFAGWAVAVLLGLYGLSAEHERAVQASLVGLAIVQVAIAVGRLRAHTGHGHPHRHDACGETHACGHGHAHHHHHALPSPADLRETRTLVVAALAAATMVGELAIGWWTNSLALVADGWHMATHVGALALAWAAYALARRLATSRHFAFGADKILALAGYTNALALAFVAVAMLREAWERFASPEAVQFGDALPAAVVGLVVNLASAKLLHPADHHGQDHNLRAAYVHVLSDALTSVLAVVALLAGRYLGIGSLDPLSAAVGALVIVVWAVGLCRQAIRDLVDVHPEPALTDLLRGRLEADGVCVLDVRVWPLGQGKRGCTLCVTTAEPRDAVELRRAVEAIARFEHLVVEVRRTEAVASGAQV